MYCYIISKVCSEGCTSSSYGQFMYANLQRKYYDVNVSFTIFFNSQSKGRYGMDVFARKFEIINTNFSHLSADRDSAFSDDQTNNGFLISYSQVSNNTDTYRTLSVQEVDSSSSRNLMTFVNILYNKGAKDGTIRINDNSVSYFVKCNFHYNEGSGYLFYLESARCYIKSCSVQETFAGSKDRICNGNNVISSEPTIKFVVNAPQIDECNVGNIKICSIVNVNLLRNLSFGCVFFAPLMSSFVRVNLLL